MARIRTVKPEFWTDERVGEVSVSARLLFIASWNFSDDHGGLNRSSKQLKAQAFPYDNIDCEPLVQELLQVGLLVEYEVSGKKYLHIKGFRTHQKVENPARPRIPVYESSPIPHRELPEESGNPPTSSGLFSGREGKVSKKRIENSPGDEPSAPSETNLNSEDPPDEIPLGLDLTAWGRWRSYRISTRKPLKPVSLPAAQRQLAAFGFDQAAVVEQSIANGWQGLFELKSGNAHGEKPKGGTSANGLPCLNP